MKPRPAWILTSVVMRIWRLASLKPHRNWLSFVATVTGLGHSLVRVRLCKYSMLIHAPSYFRIAKCKVRLALSQRAVEHRSLAIVLYPEYNALWALKMTNRLFWRCSSRAFTYTKLELFRLRKIGCLRGISLKRGLGKLYQWLRGDQLSPLPITQSQASRSGSSSQNVKASAGTSNAIWMKEH